MGKPELMEKKPVKKILDDELFLKEGQLYFYYYCNCLPKNLRKKFIEKTSLGCKHTTYLQKEFSPLPKFCPKEQLFEAITGKRRVISTVQSIEAQLEYLKNYNKNLPFIADFGMCLSEGPTSAFEVVRKQLLSRVSKIKSMFSELNDDNIQQNLSKVRLTRQLEILCFNVINTNSDTVKQKWNVPENTLRQLKSSHH